MCQFNSAQGSGRNSGNETNFKKGKGIDCMRKGEKKWCHEWKRCSTCMPCIRINAIVMILLSINLLKTSLVN